MMAIRTIDEKFADADELPNYFCNYQDENNSDQRDIILSVIVLSNLEAEVSER